MKTSKNLIITIAFTAMLGSCGNPDGSDETDLLDSLAPADWADAAAAFVDNAGALAGYVVLSESPTGGVLIRVDLEGLSQGWHGIHLHQIANCDDGDAGFKASGGHVDPDNRAHGLLNPEGPERADLPNVYAGADGRATAEIFAAGLSLFPSEEMAAALGPYPLIDEDGFAVIVHANPDDHLTQPIGGAGERVACAAITSGL